MCVSFESPYMTSYLTFIDIFSISRTIPEIFDFKVFILFIFIFYFYRLLVSKQKHEQYDGN